MGPMGPAGSNGINGGPGPVGPMGPAGPQGPQGLVEEPYASFVRSFYDFCALYSSPNQSAYTASLERELEHSGDKVAGILRLTAPSAFADSFLADVCYQFSQRYSEVSFEIDVGHHLEDLHERNFDLAIRVTTKPPENMVARKLMPYCHWVVASPEYLSANGQPTQPSDLANLQCLAFPSWRNWQFVKAGKVEEIEAKGQFAVNDNNILIKAALNHQGVTRVPEHLLWQLVREGRLQRVLSDYQVEQRQVWMLYPPKIEHSSRLQHFVAFLQQYLSQVRP